MRIWWFSLRILFSRVKWLSPIMRNMRCLKIDYRSIHFNFSWEFDMAFRVQRIELIHVHGQIQDTILIKKFPEFISENSKYKFYSSKVILSPSKYCPSTATHLFQRLIQLSKHFWNSIVGIAVFDFSIISFRLLKRVPCNDFFTHKQLLEYHCRNSFPHNIPRFSHHWIHF